MRGKCVAILLCAAMLVGCGNANAEVEVWDPLAEFLNGEEASKVFVEDTYTGLLQGKSESAKKLAEEYVRRIEETGSEEVGEEMVYSCTAPDISNAVQEIVNSKAYKTEIEKRNLTDTLDGLSDYVYETITYEIASYPKAYLKVTGEVNGKMKSADALIAPLTQALAAEIPWSVTKEREEPEAVAGDFVVDVGDARILISEVEVKWGEEADSALKELSVQNEGMGAYITFKATNLGGEDVVLDAGFVGVSDNGECVYADREFFGLNDVAEVKVGSSVKMSCYAAAQDNGKLAWYEEGGSNYLYEEVESSE